jgi:hypothetical protein
MAAMAAPRHFAAEPAIRYANGRPMSAASDIFEQ